MRHIDDVVPTTVHAPCALCLTPAIGFAYITAGDQRVCCTLPCGHFGWFSTFAVQHVVPNLTPAEIAMALAMLEGS